MNFRMSTDMMEKVTDIFSIERDGKQVASARGFFCGKNYQNTIQLVENADIQDGDWLVHSLTGKRYFAKQAKPFSMDGEILYWMVEYLTESDFQKSSKSQTQINIGTVSGPAIIGNQQTATMTVGTSIEDIAALIATKPAADLPELCELVAELKKLEANGGAIEKGRLSKFSDLLKKHSDLLIALGGWAVKLLTGN